MKRFTHRYINQVTGSFVLLALLVLIVGIYMAGHTQHWFEHTVTIGLLLPEEGCGGLRPGALVMVMGTQAGEVKDIEITSDDRMTARIIVRQDFARFIGTDSGATIKKSLGMAGDAFVEISGQRGQPLPTGTLIETDVDQDIVEILQETFQQIQRSAQKLHETIELLPETVHQTNATLEQISESTRKLHESIELLPETVHLTNATLEDIRNINKNLIQITALMPDVIENADNQVKSLSGIIVQTQASMREIQRLAEAAQRHWLIRKYVEYDEPNARIPAKEVVTP